VGVYKYGAPDYFDAMTPEALKFARELGSEGGVELGTVLLGEDPAAAPVAMALELPPGYTLPRHAHNTYRAEVIVRGSLLLSDGTTLGPGDVWTSGPGEFYGPHTAGPEGVLTVEIFASSAGLAPTPDPEGEEGGVEMTDAIRAKTLEAQGL
jgi:hypothetical protein